MTELARALSRLQAGELAEAEAICEPLLSDADQRPDALHILGMVAHQRGDGQGALRYLKDAVKADPRNGDRRLDLGLMAFEQGAYYDAVAHLEALVAGCGEVPQALNCLGNALLALGHPQQAIIRLERAVTAAPRWSKAWLDLARAYREAGEPMAAASAFEGAYRQERDESILLELGEAYLNAGALPRALRVLKKVARARPNDGLAWLQLGRALRELGHVERALKAHRAAVQALPEDARVQVELARTELRAGQLADAWARYEWRKQLPGYLSLGTPWKPGEEPPPEGPLWVYADGDQADTLALVAFVPALREHLDGTPVRLACQPELTAVLAPWAEAEGIGVEPISAIDHGDRTLGLGSIPHATKCERPPLATAPYLAPYYPSEATEPPKVGVAVERNDSDDDLAAWQALAWPDGSQLVHLNDALQSTQAAGGAGSSSADCADPRPHGPEAMVALATQLSRMSLVITTDDTVANLAGALGKPVWLLVPTTTPSSLGPSSQAWLEHTRIIQRTTLKGAQESAAAIEPFLQELST